MTRLKAGPRPARAEAGMDAPEWVEVEVVESTQEKVYPAVPPKPADGELSDEDLDSAGGGRAVKRYVPCAGQAVERGGTRS